MNFYIQKAEEILQPLSNSAYLLIDNWDDFSFKTSFYLTVVDENRKEHEIGSVKIGFQGQTTEFRTSEKIPPNFTELENSFFSLGDLSYYKNIAKLPKDMRNKILSSLNDLVYQPNLIESIRDEDVLSTSLLRDTSLVSIKGQFKRILDGGAELTNYDFYFENQSFYQSFKFEFHVKKESAPSTNIHALIGRNGSGKTTLLNQMIDAVINESSNSRFLEKVPAWLADDGFAKITEDFFSRLVSVSFSAFDPFEPPETEKDINNVYNYIGLKTSEGRLKNRKALCGNFSSAIEGLSAEKTDIWLKAVTTLESDENFADMQLPHIVESKEQAERGLKALAIIEKMSTGHAIVLLTITELIAKVEEKTLVLIDEPESHLHPPLLSAFIRVLSDLLIHRNGVAIIATHSPVVLQEIPKSCVYKIKRSEFPATIRRPRIETFGENVGTLTRDVFGLEVNHSGFYELLRRDVEDGLSIKRILTKYRNQLGLEARTHLLSLIAERDSSQDD